MPFALQFALKIVARPPPPRPADHRQAKLQRARGSRTADGRRDRRCIPAVAHGAVARCPRPEYPNLDRRFTFEDVQEWQRRGYVIGADRGRLNLLGARHGMKLKEGYCEGRKLFGHLRRRLGHHRRHEGTTDIWMRVR